MKQGKLNRVAHDIVLSLGDMRSQVDEWIKTYGEDAVLYVDAGFNNVDIVIDDREKSKLIYKNTHNKNVLDF